jgi:hypothetical protein
MPPDVLLISGLPALYLKSTLAHIGGFSEYKAGEK